MAKRISDISGSSQSLSQSDKVTPTATKAASKPLSHVPSRVKPQPQHPVGRLAGHFELSLHAANKAPRTIKSYLEALSLFSTYVLAVSASHPI